MRSGVQAVMLVYPSNRDASSRSGQRGEHVAPCSLAAKFFVGPQTGRDQQNHNHKRRHWGLLTAFLLPLLSGMGECKIAPIAVDSYCEIKATELIDLRDPGLQRLTPVNQGAVLTGDDSWNRFCKGAVNKGR